MPGTVSYIPASGLPREPHPEKFMPQEQDADANPILEAHCAVCGRAFVSVIACLAEGHESRCLAYVHVGAAGSGVCHSFEVREDADGSAPTDLVSPGRSKKNTPKRP